VAEAHGYLPKKNCEYSVRGGLEINALALEFRTGMEDE
jgi:hypothetical protein